VEDSQRRIKTQHETELRLSVNSYQHDMNDLAERKSLNKEKIENFKRQHGIHAKGIFLGEGDKIKVEKAATLIANAFRKIKSRGHVHSKRIEWLQANGLVSPNKKEAPVKEEDPIKRLASMPHVSSLVSLLGEPLEPIIGWLFKSTISTDRRLLQWERFWVKFAWENPQSLEVSFDGGNCTEASCTTSSPSAIYGPCLLLSKEVMADGTLTIPLNGCTVQEVDYDELSKHSSEQKFQFLISQPSGRQHWFAACDQESRGAWVSGLTAALHPNENPINDLLMTLRRAEHMN